jgi:DNA-binding XRE family transcriptional regulator
MMTIKKYVSPNSDEIIAARKSAGLTQTAAAKSIYCASITWQQWEAGKRKMHPAFWELFTKKSCKPVN